MNIGRTAVRPYDTVANSRLMSRAMLNIGRTAVHPYGTPSPLSGGRG
jgi:hypothetical protein